MSFNRRRPLIIYLDGFEGVRKDFIAPGYENAPRRYNLTYNAQTNEMKFIGFFQDGCCSSRIRGHSYYVKNDTIAIVPNKSTIVDCYTDQDIAMFDCHVRPKLNVHLAIIKNIELGLGGRNGGNFIISEC